MTYRRNIRLVLAVSAMLAMSHSSSAQWIYPAQGIPRLPDGTPNLAAPAPKTANGKPDLSGVWYIGRNGGKYIMDIAADGIEVPLLPWAAAVVKERRDSHLKDNPSSASCLPHGFVDAELLTFFKIVQQRELTVFLYEEYTHFRQVFMDGRPFPKNPNPAWFGYSVATWDGDALVIESLGFNDQIWLGLYPHSDALRLRERIRRRDFGHLTIEFTIDDPKTYARPWSVALNYSLETEADLIEDICENEKDAGHLVGR